MSQEKSENPGEFEAMKDETPSPQMNAELPESEEAATPQERQASAGNSTKQESVEAQVPQEGDTHQKEFLFIYAADGLDADSLMKMLEEVRQQTELKFLIADFWNTQGFFEEYGAGKAALLANSGEKLRDCASGSAFGKKIEVSWREVNGKFRVVIAAEQAMTISGVTTEEDELKRYYDAQTNGFKNPEEIEVILWGSDYLHEEKLWVEGRIPRALSYPIEPKMNKNGFEAVFLKVKAYYDGRGRPIIYRKLGLRAQVKKQTTRNN